MTGRILKLDGQEQPPLPPKRSGWLQWVLLGLALVALFAGVTIAMLHALPGPHTAADYLIAGGVATLVTMLALFGALLATHLKIPDPFYKRRPK